MNKEQSKLDVITKLSTIAGMIIIVSILFYQFIFLPYNTKSSLERKEKFIACISPLIEEEFNKMVKLGIEFHENLITEEKYEFLKKQNEEEHNRLIEQCRIKCGIKDDLLAIHIEQEVFKKMTQSLGGY